jgi:uncharacterized protein YcfJ
MRTKLKAAVGAVGIVLATQAAAQVTFYEREDLRGRAFSTSDVVDNFARIGFNDRASSAVVNSGRWEVCERAHFQGQCVVLKPGRYRTLAQMGMNNEISSVRRVDQNLSYDNRIPSSGPPSYTYNVPPNYAYSAPPAYVYDRPSDERIYEAPVTSVRAIVGPPERRCWVERQEVVENRSGPNVPGAIVGAVIGGVLGHQVGGGRGQDVATAGGAVAGAAIGSNVGRNGVQVYNQDLERCANVSRGTPPEYWDVTYNFRGIEHRVQMSAPPAGPTIAVNGNGEPRG